MKKILLVGALVISGLSYGRDFEYRERNEFQVVVDPSYENDELLSRERDYLEENMVKHSDFYRDLDNLSRGHEGK